MKKTLRKILIVFLAVSLLITALPISVAAEDGGTFSDVSVYTLSHTQTSEYGLASYEWIDSSGNTVELENYSIELYSMRNTELPSSYSSVDRGYVTPVENQGSTSLCWAYSALSTIGSYGLKNGFADMQTADFSEAHLGWFSVYPSEDINDTLYGERNPYANDPYKTGGDWDSTTAFLASGKGLALQSGYQAGIYRPDLDEADRYDRTGGLLTSAERISISQDVDTVKLSVYNYGAVEAAYYNTILDNYLGNNEYNVYKNAYYMPAHNGQTNHAISIVGWDDNFSKSNFVTAPPADGAWLVKNSWGKTFGDGGYFWISYYDASLSNFVRYTYVPDGVYENIYQYDGDMADGVLSVEGNSYIRQANVFTSKSNETLDAVSFFTLQDCVAVTVEIYRNLPEGFTSPDEGELVYSSDELIEYQGYHTVEIDENIQLHTDEIFSVVISFETLSTAYIPFNSCSEFNLGSGFVMLGDSWNTVGEESGKGLVNVCIKAFTNTVDEPVGDGALRYTVRYHIENFDGGYDVAEEIHTGLEGETVRASKQLGRGLTVDTARSNLSGVLNEDGALVLDVYVKRDIFTATFVCDGVTVSKELYFGETITLDEFKKEGYTVNWNGSLPETMPARDFELEGSYKPNEHKLVLMVNGVKFKEFTYKFGEMISELPKPAVSFGEFIGWDGSIPEIMPDKDVVLNAVFSFNDYEVTWNWNGGNRVDNVKYSASLPAPPEVADLENGDVFIGWDTAIPQKMPAYNLTFNAVYQPKSYTATFIVDGQMLGEVDFNRLSTKDGVLSEINSFAKDGYAVEWEPFELGKSDITVAGSYVPIVYTITFIADGVEVSKQPFTVETTDFVMAPEVPAKVGTISASWEEYTLSSNDITVNAVYVYPVAGMSRASKTVYVGNDYRLSVISNFDVVSTVWSSTDPRVASVDSYGYVTAVGEGECYIYAVSFGVDMTGAEIKITSRSKITVRESFEAEDLSGWLKGLFDRFFEVFLHDFAENLKHYIELLLKVTVY